MKRKEKRGNNKKVKNLAYELLKISLVVLLILTVVWISLIVYEGSSRENFKGTFKLTGILKSLGLYGGSDIEVLDWNLLNQDKIAHLNIIRNPGIGVLDSVLIVFGRRNSPDCYYNIISNLPGENEEKNYDINVASTTCGNSFSDVYEIWAYPGESNKLVSYYSFEGNANDMSNNNHNGEVNGPVPASGKIGLAYNFDGVNDIVKAEGSSLVLNKSVSVSVWFKSNSLQNGVSIIEKSCDGSGNVYPFSIRLLTNFVNFQVSNGINCNPYVNTGAFDFDSLTRWHHIVAIDNKLESELVMYLDGTAVASINNSCIKDATFDFGSDVSIGGRCYGNYFNGTIDEIKIWNYALNYSEVISEYSRGGSCVAKTCSELGKQCGSWDNGCGNSINCGVCTGALGCSSNGVCMILGCNDSDNGRNYNIPGVSQNLSLVREDVCVNSSQLREYYCNDSKIESELINCSANNWCDDGRCTNITINHAPLFLSNICGDIEFDMNNDYNLDLSQCFRDPDNNTLSFRFYNQNEYLTIRKVANNLILSPKTDWIGDGMFYIYANDSKKETAGRVNFSVGSDGEIIEQEFGIIDPDPVEENVIASKGSTKTFSIGNVDYDEIKWYLDGELVEEELPSYTTTKLKSGEYLISVEIRKGDETDTKNWNLAVGSSGSEEDNSDDQNYLAKIIFYSIILVLIFIIILVIILLIEELNRKNRTRIKLRFWK